MSHLRPGAFLKDTNILVKADNAEKKVSYSCPLCKTLAVFCKGKVVPPYFRHPPESKCTFFTAGGLMSPQHLGAQQMAKSLLESGLPITFTRRCNLCRNDCNVFEISTRTSSTCARTEEPFKINGKRYSADVALLEADEIKLIWEVYWTHATSRPDHEYPWVETCAQDILEAGSDGPLTFKCLREHRCNDCVEVVATKKREAEEAAAKLKLERDIAQKKREEAYAVFHAKLEAKREAAAEEERKAAEARKHAAETARKAAEAARKAAAEAEKRGWRPFEEQCMQDMYTYIHEANIFEIEKILMVFPGCLNERFFNGNTPMEEASLKGNATLIEFLKEQSVPLHASPAPPPTAPASPVQSQ